ncbi:MAG: enoyl-CoA hydratase [Pseudomonadales bacterium]|jgi:enoyl-CoA hydratase|nr:enoyl-CoA hydratase [Pseudomonadales bacterium]
MKTIDSKMEATHMNSPVTTTTKHGVTTVTLNRPENLNALSYEMRSAIYDTFTKLANDDETRVIILTGAGRAFTAGLDLKELGKDGLNSNAADRPSSNQDLQIAIESVGKPIIGAINGYAITGGFEIALMCDILIGSTEAKFADTHVRMGVVPGWGLSQRLSRYIGASRAKELSFTGNYLDAITAEKWGLINRVVEPEKLLEHCQALAEEICSADPLTLKTVHELIDLGWQTTLDNGLQAEKQRTRSHTGDLSAETLEQRRGQVMNRGRDQDT